MLRIGNRKKRNGEPISELTRLAYQKAVKYFLAWAEEYGLTSEDGRHRQ